MCVKILNDQRNRSNQQGASNATLLRPKEICVPLFVFYFVADGGLAVPSNKLFRNGCCCCCCCFFKMKIGPILKLDCGETVL